MCGKMFQFMVFTFLENSLNLCIFTHATVPHSKLQEEYFENLYVSFQNGMGGGNFDFLYQNSRRKFVDELEH